jgi:hypothetical protein
MTVNEAIEKLEILRKDGHGELPLYITNCASGVTSAIWAISDTPRTREKGDDGDVYFDLTEGELYANISVER